MSGRVDSYRSVPGLGNTLGVLLAESFVARRLRFNVKPLGVLPRSEGGLPQVRKRRHSLAARGLA